MTIINNESYEVYQNLMNAYNEYKPDDEEFLQDNEELVEELESLDALSPSDDDETKAAIVQLVDFLYEWFPDSVEKCEQNELTNLLNEAKKHL